MTKIEDIKKCDNEQLIKLLLEATLNHYDSVTDQELKVTGTIAGGYRTEVMRRLTELDLCREVFKAIEFRAIGHTDHVICIQRLDDINKRAKSALSRMGE